MATTGNGLSSPFLFRGQYASSNTLAMLHLKRDLQIPIILRDEDEENKGYKEGKVTTTRFGSFPHSTLIGVPWGSQVRASAVDTGSRGRRSVGQKRKRDGSEASESDEDDSVKAATVASTGFGHLLPPTPENWTTSLPHRTQVVYTPDYSYILQRLRVRPGSKIIEAGAGSGSFTHAAARAVAGHGGKVWSFEFHRPRFETLKNELFEHGLDSLVEINHRDVCEQGFDVGVQADAIFLDLPAPWLALKHLTRKGPLNRTSPIRICTFSPCIEQVQRTVNDLREYGWIEIEMIEIAAKRLEVRRERVGLQEEGLRGVTVAAASVDEALAKLRELESRAQGADDIATKEQRLTKIREAFPNRKIHLEGRLLHRAETELKTHTSYLVFAILPREWTEEDEAKAQEAIYSMIGKQKSKKQLKKAAKVLTTTEPTR